MSPRSLTQDFSFGGLNTRAQTTGLPILDSSVLQDMRVVGTDLVQRLGVSRVVQFSGNAKAADLVAASSQYFVAAVDANAWSLGTQFTIEVLVTPDIVTPLSYSVFHVGTSDLEMKLYINGATGNWEWVVRDSTGAAGQVVVTVGAPTAGLLTSIQMMRDGTALTTRLNNVAGGTGTMSALAMRTPAGNIEIGASGAANFFDGRIDKFDVLTIVKTDHNDRLIRLSNPRAKYVRASYDFKQSNSIIYDRSRYANHLVATNTPTEFTSLSWNPAPVRALSMFVDPTTNRKQLLCAAGGLYYLADCD